MKSLKEFIDTYKDYPKEGKDWEYILNSFKDQKTNFLPKK